jgi:FkbM family methyltransferase
MPEQKVNNLQAIFFRDFKNSYIPNILEEIYKHQVYKPFLIGRRDLTIVDVGANIGLTAYYFKDFAKTVYAVEPAKEHTEVIQTMLDYNKITNVKICPVAISNKNGTTRFYHNENVTMYSLEKAVNKQDDFEEVRTVTMDTFMQEQGIEKVDLLKLDCEGSESKVISSKEFQECASKIKVIVGEWHAWTEMSKDLFANTFRDLGYNFRWLGGTEAAVFTAVRI